MRTFFASATAAFLLALVASRALASPGALDENGCHYERKRGNYHCHREEPANTNRNAAVKKSRENICHDRHSPNYEMLRYFVAYRTMDECLMSGGRQHFNGR